MEISNKKNNITEIENLKKELEIEKWISQKSDAAFRALYKELEKNNEIIKSHDMQKSYFVSNVAHEFKNPLAVIKESLCLVLDGLIGEISIEQKEILSMAKKDIDRLIRLVKNLLDLSKIEAGKMELKKEEVDIGSLIDEKLVWYKIEISKKKIIVNKNIQKDIGRVFADKDKMEEVIINLLDNAVKYTPLGGNISIRLMGTKDEIRFEILDSGQGIAKDDLKRLFNKFERITLEKEKVQGWASV